jgi:transposase InsO family protein
MAAEGLSVQTSCRVFGVSTSGFYQRRIRGPSPRAIRHVWLTDLIRQVHVDSRGTYGARRVHAELTLGHGITAGHNAVEMLMRRAGLAGITGRPKFRRVANVATSDDLVSREFGRSHANELWVTDITEHPTREGKVYCAVVLDAWSRRVVGWSIDSSPNAALVTNALGMAIDQRRPEAGSTVIHSDQGTQGGLNGSSQHLLMMGVCGGGATTAVGGPGASAGDSVAGAATLGPVQR